MPHRRMTGVSRIDSQSAVRSCSFWLHSKPANPPTKMASPTKCPIPNSVDDSEKTTAHVRHKTDHVRFANTSRLMRLWQDG